MVATMMVAGYASIHESYEHKEAIRILAIMGGISVLAPAVGPLFGSIVLKFGTWRTIFWVIVVWSTVSIISLHKWMPETYPQEMRKKIEWRKLVASYQRIILNKKFITLMLVLGFMFCGFIVWITAGPLLVIERFQKSPMEFGLIQAVIFSAYIFGSHGVSHVVKRVETNTLIWTGLSITSIGGLFLLLSSIIFPRGLYLFLAMVTVYSLGSALCFSPLNRLIIDSSDEPMGLRVAMFTVCFTGFGALGSVLASMFYNGNLISLSCPIFIGAMLAGGMFILPVARKGTI